MQRKVGGGEQEEAKSGWAGGRVERKAVSWAIDFPGEISTIEIYIEISQLNLWKKHFFHPNSLLLYIFGKPSLHV